MNKTRRPRSDNRRVPTKFFTLAEANRAMPLVRRIVQDLREEFDRVREAEAGTKTATGSDREALRHEYHRRVDLLRELAEELEAVGCELKDPQIGLIDFPAMLESRMVYLCWKLGEPTVGHWHETAEGLAGRREIEAEFDNSAAV